MGASLDLAKIQNQMFLKNAKEEIIACNDISRRFGLSLSDDEASRLVDGRMAALKSSGRIEFAGGILPKLIYAFCDSPYIQQNEYEVTLAELQEAFYYFKSESEDRYTDDELIDFMLKVFNGRANGSTEYLIGTSLEALCRYAEDDFDDEDADKAGDLF